MTAWQAPGRFECRWMLSTEHKERCGELKDIEPRLKAPWIWFDAGRERNVFARGRRAFDLEEVPERAALRITCSGFYRLWVNGRYAARGPAQSLPHKKRYDILDVAPHLRTGRNVLAVQVIHFGYRTALVAAARGGFWCQLALPAEPVGSDEQWRFSVDPCYNPETQRRNGNYGIVEEYDARQEERWREPDYDDSSWQPAHLLRDGRSGVTGPRVQPWTDMVPRGVEQCAEDLLLPEAVVRVGEVQDHESNAENLAWFLMQEVPVEPEYTEVEDADSLLDPEAGPAVVRQPSPLDRDQPHRRCATIILDLGRELSGFGWFEVEGNEGAVVDAAFGECLRGGRVPVVRQGVQYGDRYVLKEGRQRHEVYDWKGFRYMQLTFRELTRPLKLHGAGINYFRYPLEPAGRFECSDRKTTRIWEVGAHTQQLCTNDGMMDTPWREQQQWLGDGRVQLLILQNAFGERAMTRKFVEQFAEAQGMSGMIPCVSNRPGFAIVDYALWWVQAVLDVLLHDGDAEFAGRFVPNMERLLEWFAPFENPDGLLESVPGWVFIDWANVGREGTCAPLNATYCIALEAGAVVAEKAGRREAAEEWRRRAGCLRDAFHGAFYDPERDLYVDNLVGGRRTEMFSQHTQSIAVLAGLTRGDERELMRRTAESEDLVRTQPYFSFYLLEALGQVGLARLARDFIRERWGAMLDEGATSFWEEWQFGGTFRGGRWVARPRSHCHAWSAAPTAWLSRYVLGVRVDSPDGPVLVAPQTCGLERAEGSVPTRWGPIGVAWEVRDGRFSVEVDAPEDAPVEFREPADYAGLSDFHRV